jgi:hypothetical protein
MDYGECEPSLGTKDNPVSIHFRMSMDNSSSSMTRAATWGDEYTSIAGNSFDEQIDVSTVRVSVFEGETFKGAVSELICYKSGDTYEFYGEISNIEFEANHDYKFMVFANCASVDDYEETGSYNNLTFNTTDVVLNQKYIPMWGVKEFKLTQSGIAGNDQYLYDLDIIYMLRSVAKVQVFLGQGVTDFTIKSVTIRNHGASGYSLPLSWNKVANTQNLSWKDENTDAHSFNPKQGIATSGLNLSAEVEGAKYVAYLPEQVNDGNVVMDVVVVDNAGAEYTFENAIYLKDYASGQTLDLMRNHYYEYTITKVNTGVNLELTCKVQPWTLVKEEWDYTDVPAVYTGGYITWSSSSSVNNGRVNLTSSNATFTFGLSAPENATWRAEFVTIKGNQNAFKFTEVQNGNAHNNGAYATGDVGKLVTLTIGTTGTATVGNNEAYLRIWVILPDGRTIRVSDMLYSANEEKEYVIVQTPII